jgi:hypothetical protein
MSEKLTKKIANSPENKNKKKNNKSCRDTTTWEGKDLASNYLKSKDSNKLLSTLTKDNKLQQQLFSEHNTNTKSFDDPNLINKVKNLESKTVSKLDPNEITEKNYKTFSEIEMKNSHLIKSNFPEKKIKSHRTNMVVFKKFSQKMNTSKSPMTKSVNKGFENINVSEIELTDPMSPKNIDSSPPTQESKTFDFIENTNKQNMKKFPKQIQLTPIKMIPTKNKKRVNQFKNMQISEKGFKLYQAKKITPDDTGVLNQENEILSDKNLDNDDPTMKKSSKKTSKFNTEKTLRSREDFKNAYDSIGKIKEFVKKSSVIDIKPITLTQDLGTVRRNQKGNNPLYQSEQGMPFFGVFSRI